MSDSFKIQQNVKVNNDLINLRADNADEFKAIAEWTIANAALFVNVQAALNGVPPALAANVTHTQVQNGTASDFPGHTDQQQPPAQQQYQQEPAQSPWGQPQQSAPPPFAQQQAAPGPTCMHGPMEYKDFTSKAGNHVKGHFCTVRNSQCKPVYAPRGQ